MIEVDPFHEQDGTFLTPCSVCGVRGLEHPLDPRWKKITDYYDALPDRGSRNVAKKSDDVWSATMKNRNADGTENVYRVSCGKDLVLHVEELGIDDHKEFWSARWKQWDPKKDFVAGGGVYRKGDREGFGGREFEFRSLKTGVTEKYTGLWFSGVVPPSFRDIFEDTHEFVGKSAYMQTFGRPV